MKQPGYFLPLRKPIARFNGSEWVIVGEGIAKTNPSLTMAIYLWYSTYLRLMNELLIREVHNSTYSSR